LTKGPGVELLFFGSQRKAKKGFLFLEKGSSIGSIGNEPSINKGKDGFDDLYLGALWIRACGGPGIEKSPDARTKDFLGFDKGEVEGREERGGLACSGPEEAAPIGEVMAILSFGAEVAKLAGGVGFEVDPIDIAFLGCDFGKALEKRGGDRPADKKFEVVVVLGAAPMEETFASAKTTGEPKSTERGELSSKAGGYAFEVGPHPGFALGARIEAKGVVPRDSITAFRDSAYTENPCGWLGQAWVSRLGGAGTLVAGGEAEGIEAEFVEEAGGTLEAEDSEDPAEGAAGESVDPIGESVGATPPVVLFLQDPSFAITTPPNCSRVRRVAVFDGGARAVVDLKAFPENVLNERSFLSNRQVFGKRAGEEECPRDGTICVGERSSPALVLPGVEGFELEGFRGVKAEIADLTAMDKTQSGLSEGFDQSTKPRSRKRKAVCG
jgi:hypothetical protein